MSDENLSTCRRPLLDALDRILRLCAVAVETGEPSRVALLAALDEIEAAATEIPGPLATAAVLLAESWVRIAARPTAADHARLRDAQAILGAALAAERARALDDAHRLT